MARGTRSQQRRRRRWALLAVLLALAAPACFTPPAVAPAGFPELRAIDYPPDAEFVELPVADGVVLRGVFLSAGPGAPVVVHFPAMLESVTGGARRSGVVVFAEDGWLVGRHDVMGMQLSARILPLADGVDGAAFGPAPLEHGLFTAARRAGLSVLCVDYAGVGASSGHRSPEHLARDARAIWAEALRRVDGDPQRVVLRGVSLGTLAVAALLTDGAHPGAVSLAAPVRGESVVGHFVRGTQGDVLALLADWLYADVGSADLQAQVERNSAELFLALPEHDALLSDDERTLLRYAAEHRGASVLVHGALHEQLALEARTLLPGELAFLETNLVALPRARAERAAALLAGLEADPLVAGKLRALDSDGRARLEELVARRPWPDPRLPLLFASPPRGVPNAEAFETWCDWRDPAALADMTWNALEALLQLDDPQLALDPAWIEALASDGPALRATLATRADVDGLARRVAAMGGRSTGSLRWLGAEVRLADPASALLSRAYEFADLARRAAGLERDVAARVALRLALRAAGVPDRVLPGDTGLRHEVWWDGAWVDVSSAVP